MPINALEGPHISLPQMYLQLPLATEQHLADYVTRLEKIPTLIDQQIVNMRAGMKAGRQTGRQTGRQAGMRASGASQRSPRP